jgi:hypothetical protein
MREKVFKIATFVALFFLATAVFPYLATRESYEPAKTINGAFPIAVFDDGKPTIVTWPQYQQNLERYKDKAILGKEEKEYSLNELEHFRLIPEGNNTFRVDLLADDYRYWSVYSIRDGVVHPISFRYTGAFSIFACLPFALAGTSSIWWFRRRRLARRRAL